MVTADPEGRPNSLSYIGLCTFHIYPGTDTVSPERRLNFLLHTGVCTTLVGRFSLVHKNSEVHGADLLSFSGALYLPLPPFEPHQVVVLLLFSILILGPQT